MGFDHLPLAIAQPRRPSHDARFHLMPEDVAAELATGAHEPMNRQDFRYLLAVRRLPFVYSSVSRSSRQIQDRTPYNLAFMNPQDMAAQELAEGGRIKLASEHGWRRTTPGDGAWRR